MNLKKTIIILTILCLFVLPACNAALNTELKAPNDFEKADNWDKAVYDIYSLKNDKNQI